MLQSYLNDWAKARENAVVIEEQKDENGNLMLQRAEVVFQGVKIEIRNKRVIGANSPKPDDKFCAEFFVPSTITLIDAFKNSNYPHTEFIATLLDAIDPDYDLKQKDAIQRRRESMDTFMNDLTQEWKTTLEHTKYSEAELNFIIEFSSGLIRRERTDNVTRFVQIMAKYQDDILNNMVVMSTYDGRDITNMDVLYDLLCRSCSKRALAESNKFIVTANGANYVFLDEEHDEKMSDFNVNAKNILRSIYTDCNNVAAIFTTVAYGIASFYAYKFNEPIAYRLAKVSERMTRKPRRDRTVAVDVMMNNIAGAFENAKPIKKKGKKG